MVTMLSIDGGGIRGIIPAVILVAFEKELQNEENKRKTGHIARIAHYFDAIGGTSTGGLIAAMLTTPDPKGQNLPYSAYDILKFYKEKSRHIFEAWFSKSLSNTEAAGSEEQALEATGSEEVSLDTRGLKRTHSGKQVKGTITPWQTYKGDNLHDTVKAIMGNKTIGETVTDLVIPTFDVSLQHPIIFSTDEAKKYPPKNAKVADICIGTSAAPTYFPAHSFKVADKTYNLIDGGLAANNPTECVMSYVSKKLKQDGQCFRSKNPIKPNDYSKFLVISLGTGDIQDKRKYTAKEVAAWSVLFGWLNNRGTNPLLDFLMDGSAHMVDYAVQSNFNNMDDALEKHYLRIQTTELNKDTAKLDNVDQSNLRNLEELGRKLLNEKVKMMNLETGKYECIPGDNRTNWDALSLYAKQLVDQRIKKEKTSGKM